MKNSKTMKQVDQSNQQISVETAKQILMAEEKRNQEILQQAQNELAEVLKSKNLRLGTRLNKKEWLELGNRFLNGEEFVILETHLFKNN